MTALTCVFLLIFVSVMIASGVLAYRIHVKFKEIKRIIREMTEMLEKGK